MDKNKLLALGAICLAVVAAVLVEWRASQSKTAAPAFAQIAVTQPIRIELMKIGRAEQSYYAEHSRYGSFEELISSGALEMKSPVRGVYRFTAEVDENGFVVTARAEGEEADRWPVLTINQRMEVEQQPATAGRK